MDNENNRNRAAAAIPDEERSREELLEMLQQKDALISNLRAEVDYLSYEDMETKFGGLPDMPRVKELKPHEHQGSAEFSVDNEFVTADDLNFTFSPIEKATGYKLRSFLRSVQLQENPQDKTGPKILCYHNEATVADYVQHVVVMCLQSLGLFEKSLLCKEMSLLSLRPDLILVMHNTKGIILIIEVKMPGDELFNSGGIAKQVSDYLLLQYRLGNTTPFVLLTSYLEACLCHLKPGCLQAADTSEASGGDEYRAIVMQAAEQLKNPKQGVNLGNKLGNSEADHKAKPMNHSPRQNSFQGNGNFSPPTTLSIKRRRIEKPIVKRMTPEVIYSQPFNRTNMVKGVSLAIACGIVSLEKASTTSTEHRFWPDQKSCIDGLHPQVEEGALHWVQVRNMFIDYTEAPLTKMADRARKGCEGDFTVGKFILFQELGRGNSGKVFLAVDELGAACALKFYLDVEGDVQAEKGFSHQQRKKDRALQLEIGKEAAHEEWMRWNLLQPTYSDYVACHELNNEAVLRMPVLAPLPPKQRGDVLGTVTEMLRNFFNKGYVYKEVRWRHVAYRVQNGTGPEMVLALVDLGSLLKIEDLKKLNPTELAEHNLEPPMNIDASFVQKQVELLKRKISESPEVPPRNLF